MIITPPFYLSGETGASLGAEGYLFSSLGETNAVLTIKSLAPDTLSFSIRDNGSRPAIPDDGQWLTLRDDAGQVLFIGVAKRSFQYPERVYRYECANVYQGLGESPLLSDAGRPYLIHAAGDLGARVSNVLTRASAAGLSIQAPVTMPEFYVIPKMAFRAATFSSAMEDTLKWAPDAATRMDYSTTPPTLNFFCRGQSEAVTIDLFSDGHRATSIDLTPLPEARALGISFVYARRDGDAGVIYLEQTAGDLAADANRRLSVYLSGEERGDMLISEALMTAQAAVDKANEIIIAAALSLDAVAAAAQIPLTLAGLKGLDSNLQAAVTAQADFSMYASTGESILLYTASNWSGSSPSVYTSSLPTTALALRTSGGALASGWYPIVSGAFTDEQLATAGATKESRVITGDLLSMRFIDGSDLGMSSLESAGASVHDGWIDGYGFNQAGSDADYRKYIRYGCNITVDAINMSPTAVAAAVNAAAAGGAASAFISRADFVEAPEDLAQNYFERQDWTPYRGNIALSPSAPYIPVPGDFLNILGEHAPEEWASMAAPVSETMIDLSTCVPRIGIGPSPSQDFHSLIDRLRIPPEDNYQAG